MLRTQFDPKTFLILVVDDVPLNLKVVGSILDRAGYTTVFASNGLQALELSKTTKPDLILLDLMMPGMDGLEVCHMLQADAEHTGTPIIFLTASYERTHPVQALEQGAVDYIVKPFNPPELLARVRTHLELKHNRDQLETLLAQVNRLNLTLEEKVEQRTAQLQQAIDFEATVKQITDKVRDSLDETQILQTVVQAIADTLKVDGCNAGMYQAQEQISEIQYEWNRSLPSLLGTVHQIADLPDLYPTLFQGESLQFCWVVHPDHLIPPMTILACPIRIEQEVLGDLWLYRPSHTVFADNEIRLVQQIAGQCAIALRQARLYRAAQRQVQELERLDRLKTEFLKTVSHELRTPIANIQMATVVLKTLFDKMQNPIEGEEFQRFLALLQEESQHEMNLINDLLDFIYLEAGAEPLVFKLIDLKSVLPYLADIIRERIKQRNQQLHVTLSEDLPLLYTDLYTLEQVVAELLDNACKYTPDGEHIWLIAERKATGIRLQVSNSGVNVADLELDRIFERFYRIPNHDPWKYSGTGLGLALVKKRVQHLGGSIQAVSEHDRFTLILEFPEPSEAQMLSTPRIE